eukprot:360444-Chlamydomonas_euryale.AAC.1
MRTCCPYAGLALLKLSFQPSLPVQLHRRIRLMRTGQAHKRDRACTQEGQGRHTRGTGQAHKRDRAGAQEGQGRRI